ncbi:5'/3'-nucleotidase SurE [Chitinophaga parva]|uniref:5'-nucleotidase SurE n=1 Tax=Chitinophaga parva TaxID=2169414 RepID=A0A2T7BN98_9BACT|nr:5'/3'-nucleotidase SurE [Chitinophaga parva]
MQYPCVLSTTSAPGCLWFAFTTFAGTKNHTVANSEKIILVTNDDGITAPGIRELVEAVKPLGKVVVVAPDSPQSGMGHAITIGVPLRLNRVDIFDGVEAWTCSGTPVDCVKLARDKILHGKPDFCVSGINHGANHSINVIYSGTMSAAMEAAIEGIPSAGFSYLDYSYEADFTLPARVARQVVEKMVAEGLPEGGLLNVNIPFCKIEDFQGVRICRQANAKYVEAFDERRDPHGKKYYWLTGEFKNLDTGTDTDVWALDNNYASIVPVQFDLTNYALKQQLSDTWKF